MEIEIMSLSRLDELKLPVQEGEQKHKEENGSIVQTVKV